MATNNVVTEANRLEPQAAPGDGDASVQVRIQVAVTAASMSQSDSVSAPPKVVPSGQPSTCAVSGPRTSPPVVVVANAGVSAGNQQTTKQPQNQVASVKQVTTTGRTVLITVPRSATAQPVTPRLPQATSPHLPANIQIPPGELHNPLTVVYTVIPLQILLYYIPKPRWTCAVYNLLINTSVRRVTCKDNSSVYCSVWATFMAGMMLIRSDSGQLMLVSQQALVQAQQGQRLISGQPTRILAPQVGACAWLLFYVI